MLIEMLLTGGEVVGGVGDVASPSKGWHHALQGPCHCILSEFKQGTAEDQQVSLASSMLLLPTQAHAAIELTSGTLRVHAALWPNPHPVLQTKM